jgi:hypothetical protein
MLSRRELLALVAVFALTLPAVTPRIYASDEIQYFAYLRSLWFDRDVSFENEYRYFYDRDVARGEGFHATFLELETEAGRRPNFATMGCAILWAPFYAVGDAIARVREDVPADGFSQPYIAAVAYASGVYGFVAILLSIAAARRVTGRGLAAGVLLWIGTPLLFYMYVAPPFAHATSAFAVALFVTVWLHVRRAWSVRGAVALGVTGALMAMVREQDVLFTLGPAADFMITAARTPRAGGERAVRTAALVKTAVAGCLAFAIAFLPQLFAYWALNGHPGPSRLVTRKMSWHAPHALGVLASPSHGFLFWTPLAIFAIAGLIALTLRSSGDVRRIGGCALLMVALQIYVGGSVESWTLAGAFGQRRLVALTILLTIGLAATLAVVRSVPWRPLLAAALTLCVWWNLALIAQFGTGMMDRQRLELRSNAYNAFVTLPRMAPDLAWRYLTRRDSFYRSGMPGTRP